MSRYEPDVILIADDGGRADLAHIIAPVLLVWGDRDTLVGRAMQDALVARFKNVELRRHAGEGHTPRWDDPARFAAEVTTFVRSCFAGGDMGHAEIPGTSGREDGAPAT